MFVNILFSTLFLSGPSGILNSASNFCHCQHIDESPNSLQRRIVTSSETLLQYENTLQRIYSQYSKFYHQNLSIEKRNFQIHNNINDNRDSKRKRNDNNPEQLNGCREPIYIAFVVDLSASILLQITEEDEKDLYDLKTALLNIFHSLNNQHDGNIYIALYSFATNATLETNSTKNNNFHKDGYLNISKSESFKELSDIIQHGKQRRAAAPRIY